MNHLPITYTGRMIMDGIVSYIPGCKNFGLKGMVITGKLLPARYYYSVWLRHLVMAYENGLPVYPHTVAELGPGQSVGTGLCVLLSGASTYYALDLVEFASGKTNLELFYELVDLFQNRVAIPDNTEFSSVEPILESYEFPNHILTDELLDRSLHEDRIISIESALMTLGPSSDKTIVMSYRVPWNDSGIILDGSVDLILSQAVLEHVDNLSDTYGTMYRWLKPGGFMSHAIDFRSHGLADDWNGQWTYSRRAWRLIRGRRPYLINRQPYSAHINLMKKTGFEIVSDMPLYRKSKIRRKRLASEFSGLSDQDLNTKTMFVQAIKRT